MMAGQRYVESLASDQGWSILYIDKVEDREVGGITFEIFSLAASTRGGIVFNAWAVTGFLTNICSLDAYPTMDDALAYHIGKCIMEGLLSIVDICHENG